MIPVTGTVLPRKRDDEKSRSKRGQLASLDSAKAANIAKSDGAARLPPAQAGLHHSPLMRYADLGAENAVRPLAGAAPEIMAALLRPETLGAAAHAGSGRIKYPATGKKPARPTARFRLPAPAPIAVPPAFVPDHGSHATMTNRKTFSRFPHPHSRAHLYLPPDQEGGNTLQELRNFARALPHDQLLPAIYAAVDVLRRDHGKGQEATQIRRWFIVGALIDVVLRDVAGVPLHDRNFRLPGNEIEQNRQEPAIGADRPAKAERSAHKFLELWRRVDAETQAAMERVLTLPEEDRAAVFHCFERLMTGVEATMRREKRGS